MCFLCSCFLAVHIAKSWQVHEWESQIKIHLRSSTCLNLGLTTDPSAAYKRGFSKEMDFIALQQRTEMASVEQDIAEIRIARKVYDESAPLLGTAQSTTKESPTGRRSRVQAIKTKLTSCSCSRDRVKQFFIGLFPIIKWLPKYNIKNDLVADISGGLTVGIMHIPQGNNRFFDAD